MGAPVSEVYLEAAEQNIDGLNYPAGKSVQFVNSKAYQGALLGKPGFEACEAEPEKRL